MLTMGEILRAGGRGVMQERRAEGDKFHRELDRLLAVLAAQRRRVESEARRPALVIPLGETAEAQVVLAAQLRFKRRAGQRG